MPEFEMMGLLSWLVMGLLAGLLGRFLLPGRDAMGCIVTTLTGIVGAVVGGFVATWLGFGGFRGLRHLQPAGGDRRRDPVPDRAPDPARRPARERLTHEAAPAEDAGAARVESCYSRFSIDEVQRPVVPSSKPSANGRSSSSPAPASAAPMSQPSEPGPFGKSGSSTVRKPVVGFP